MIYFTPYVIIFKTTPPRVILKKSLLTHLRKVKNELLLIHHKSSVRIVLDIDSSLRFVLLSRSKSSILVLV
jgi:hypothetical protein